MTTQFIRPYVVQEYTHMRASKGKPTHHTRYIHAVLRHLEEKYDSCSAQEPAELSGAAIDECCEYVIGVLFASHKNVAIGAAQCIVYLLSTPAHTHTHTPTHTHTEALDTSYISRLRAAVAEHELTRTHVLEHWGAEKKGGEKGGVICDAVMPLLDKVVCVFVYVRISAHTHAFITTYTIYCCLALHTLRHRCKKCSDSPSTPLDLCEKSCARVGSG
jgi:hypothetical protein